jgi:prepilin-type processing-associated H-X9-DG protein
MIDALMLVAVVLVVAAVLLSGIARSNPHRPASRVACVNSLKQVGLAYRIWAGDNNDSYPMQVSTNQGGSMELALRGNVLATFQSMSNELSTPKILICPNDSKREAATNFFHLSARNVSYFVGVDSVETNAFMLLGGDYNITNGTRIRAGLLTLSTHRPSGWTEALHNNAGNLLFADGSVQQVTTPALRAAVAATGFFTNRIALP